MKQLGYTYYPLNISKYQEGISFNPDINMVINLVETKTLIKEIMYETDR